MFDDERSKRVLLVAHCILNQNAKIDRCAHYPGIVTEVIRVLTEAGVGLIQLPCPELLLMGLDRGADRTSAATIEEEDARVGRCMMAEAGRALCRELAGNLVYQIEEYRKQGFEVVGMLGINGSPTCGVEMDHEQHQPGVFIQTLGEALAKQGLSLRMRGIRVYQIEQALAAVRELVGG